MTKLPARRVGVTFKQSKTDRHMFSASKWILLIGLAFWFGETWYFGWNANAQSSAERICDTVAISIVFMGVIYRYRFVRRDRT